MAGVYLHQIGQAGQPTAAAAGLEAPFDILSACHERVERMLSLMKRLQHHVRDAGWDEQGAQAARDVMRYFDLAAPLHHEDEELHVFPPLMAGPDGAVKVLVFRLIQDHRQMEATWGPARTVLQAVADGNAQTWTPLTAPQHVALCDFASLYQRHLEIEDRLVYPAAARALSPADLKLMSRDMMGRRGVKA